MIKEVVKHTLKSLTAGTVAYVTRVVVIGGVICTVVAIDEVQARIRYNRHIKKGLKDGSVVCIDGKYYNVIVEDVQ